MIKVSKIRICPPLKQVEFDMTDGTGYIAREGGSYRHLNVKAGTSRLIKTSLLASSYTKIKIDKKNGYVMVDDPKIQS